MATFDQISDIAFEEHLNVMSIINGNDGQYAMANACSLLYYYGKSERRVNTLTIECIIFCAYG